MIIEVAFSLGARDTVVVAIDVPEGACVAQALAQWSTQQESIPHECLSPDAVWSLYGRRVGPSQPLISGDRLEWTRPLRVDPKVARRERFASQGVGRAGLFANRRPPSKS